MILDRTETGTMNRSNAADEVCILAKKHTVIEQSERTVTRNLCINEFPLEVVVSND